MAFQFRVTPWVVIGVTPFWIQNERTQDINESEEYEVRKVVLFALTNKKAPLARWKKKPELFLRAYIQNSIGVRQMELKDSPYFE